MEGGKELRKKMQQREIREKKELKNKKIKNKKTQVVVTRHSRACRETKFRYT
jgi:hypothetical protein